VTGVGAGGHGSPAARVLWGRGRGHGGGGEGALGKKIEGGALPNRGVSVGQWGGTARWRLTAVKPAQWSSTMGL
jgi:hypothetical protein